MSHTPDEIKSVYGFLKQTPEGNLRKMLVDKDLTDLHFRTLMKIVKGAPEDEFVEGFQNETMGKLRLSAKEQPIKENFWYVCKIKLMSLGLISKQNVQKAA